VQTRKLGKNGPEVSAISIGTSWGINSLSEWHQSKKQLSQTLHQNETFCEGAFKGERYPPAFLSWVAS
jgi:hypothetical protein